MDCKYLINMKDGRFVFRNAETDTHVNLRPVPDSIVDLVVKGEITKEEVIKAISAKIKETEEFDLEKYIADLRKLNVRVANPQEAPVHEVLQDRSSETISVEDVTKVRSSSQKRQKADDEKKIAKMDAAIGKSMASIRI